MHEIKWNKIFKKWSLLSIENTSQRGCIPEALEHGVTECHPYVFSSLSSCFQILSTLTHSAWSGGSSWAQFVSSLLKVPWVAIDSGKLQESQGVRQKVGLWAVPVPGKPECEWASTWHQCTGLEEIIWINTVLKGRRYGNTILKTEKWPHSMRNVFANNVPYRIMTHFNAMNWTVPAGGYWLMRESLWKDTGEVPLSLCCIVLSSLSGCSTF